jgi:hypothetical protein
MKKRYKYAEILYVPNVIENRSVAIGIIIWEPAERALIEVSKRTDWSAVLRLDPDADTEFLSATVDHIEREFRQRDEAGRERLIAQLSMNVTLSDPLEIEADDLGEALKQLTRPTSWLWSAAKQSLQPVYLCQEVGSKLIYYSGMFSKCVRFLHAVEVRRNQCRLRMQMLRLPAPKQGSIAP